MTFKLSYFALLPLLISALLYSSYWPTAGFSSPPAAFTNRTSTAKILALNTIKPQEVFSIPSVNEQPAQVQSNAIDLPTNEAGLYHKLDHELGTLQTQGSLHLTDINYLAECGQCLQLLHNALLNNTFSTQHAADLANAISLSQHPKFAALLTKAIEVLFHRGQAARAERLLVSLENFDSPTIAEQFIHFIGKANIPYPLQNTLINVIDATSQREPVANAIVSVFNQSSGEAKQRLLAIDQPEALAQLNRQALLQGDMSLYNQTVERLKSDPSPYTLDVLLDLKNHLSLSANESDSWTLAAYELAQRQLSGSRLDYIERKLASGGYSEQDKRLVLDVLNHSEDATRGSEIISKFSN